MSSIPTFKFDTKLFLLTSRMRLKVNCVFAPFWIVNMNLIQKKTHMMLALMLDPMFKDLSIVNNYVGRDMPTIATTRYDSKTLIPPSMFNLSESECFCRANRNVCHPRATVDCV
jgi:hypothetical protein